MITRCILACFFFFFFKHLYLSWESSSCPLLSVVSKKWALLSSEDTWDCPSLAVPSSQFRCTCSCAVRSQCVMTPCDCRQRRCKSAVWSAGLDDVHFGGILETARPWEKKCDVRARGGGGGIRMRRLYARIPVGDSTVSIRCCLLALRKISTIKNNN